MSERYVEKTGSARKYASALNIPVCHSARNFKSCKSSPYTLHGVPPRVKSAVKLFSERCTLLAVYPGQLLALSRTVELPHWTKLAHKRKQMCKKVIAGGVTTATGTERLRPSE